MGKATSQAKRSAEIPTKQKYGSEGHGRGQAGPKHPMMTARKCLWVVDLQGERGRGVHFEVFCVLRQVIMSQGLGKGGRDCETD